LAKRPEAIREKIVPGQAELVCVGDQAQGPAATKPVVTEDLKEIVGGATEASTGSSGNDSSVGREPEAAVAAEAGGGDEQGEAIAKETTKEVVDNLGDWSGAVQADARGEPEAEIIFPQ
jgi:hypothetical protein